jgi:hypothetical protein
MLRKQVLALGAVLGIVCSPMSANAVEWTVGLGGGVAPDYEGSDEYELVPLWNIRANDLYDPNTYVQVLGPKLNSNFLPHNNLRLGLSGQYVAERDDVDNDQVDRLSSTDDGFMLGALLGYDFKLSGNRVWGFEFDPRWDVSDDIGGLFTRSGLTISRPSGDPGGFAAASRAPTPPRTTWTSTSASVPPTRQPAASTPSTRTTASRTLA